MLDTSDRDAVESKVVPSSRAIAATLRRELSRFAVALALVLVVAIFSFWLPGIYFTTSNLLVTLGSQAVILILALGATLTLRLGDLDISFGATMTVGGVIVGASTQQWHIGLGLGILAVVAFGVVVGAVNALLVVGLGLSSFVATLGVMTVVTGIGFGISHTAVVTGLSPSLLSFIQQRLVGLPVGVWLGWLLALALWLLYEWTAFGRVLLFIGGSRNAAVLLGLPVARVRAAAYVVSSVIYALAGVVLAGQIGTADPSISAQYLLPPLAAAFLGTTVIR
ncbi:MAG: ABC transporter permease, partial [Actinobacteria bacterium]|nr:ABC transporter permease [Actinomycetota bacterium]